MIKLKSQYKIVVAAASLGLIIAVPFFIYLSRSPVLIVADLSSVPLYGEVRIRAETRKASLALFRKVRTVTVADDVSDDIIRFAIAEVSSSPYCVIFPLRFVNAARLYRENTPKAAVVLLEGRYNKDGLISTISSNQSGCFVYKTDIDDEFQRAAMAAAALDMGKNGKIAVFIDQNIQPPAKDAFLWAINSHATSLETLFFSSFSEFNEIPDLSCAVLAGAGIEFIENNQDVPVIFLTWIDPSLMPANVAIVIDDSPWAQAVHAVKMASAGMADGQIASKFIIIDKKNIDKKTLRNLKK